MSTIQLIMASILSLSLLIWVLLLTLWPLCSPQSPQNYLWFIWYCNKLGLKLPIWSCSIRQTWKIIFCISSRLQVRCTTGVRLRASTFHFLCISISISPFFSGCQSASICWRHSDLHYNIQHSVSLNLLTLESALSTLSCWFSHRAYWQAVNPST